ncbi:MAG TPA: sigma-70 family RNA polymerase sigma factor [Flavitalea sp.]|nr:sigma-70 family RNA polymerase sigma factor [Flavitalea sp.]
MVRKASQGDVMARAMLYQQFSQQMFSICVRMTGHYDIKDLLHDSFIVASNRLDQLREIHLFGPWLRKIVVNECIKNGKTGFMWQALDEEIMSTHHDEDVDWLKEIDFSRIHEEIKNLPPDAGRYLTCMFWKIYSPGDSRYQEKLAILRASQNYKPGASVGELAPRRFTSTVIIRQNTLA